MKKGVVHLEVGNRAIENEMVKITNSFLLWSGMQ